MRHEDRQVALDTEQGLQLEVAQKREVDCTNHL